MRLGWSWPLRYFCSYEWDRHCCGELQMLLCEDLTVICNTTVWPFASMLPSLMMVTNLMSM